MHLVAHPGDVRSSRMDIVPCNARPIEVTLEADCYLEDAVEQALSPLAVDSAWLEISAAKVAPLNYVIPAEAPDDKHVAWYSDTKGFDNGQIDHLGMIVGRHNGASFLHGHGAWTPQGEAQAMGHILAPHTRLAAPTTATGIGLRGVRFERKFDPETHFDLFHAESVGDVPVDVGFAAVRLLPNQDFATALDEVCHTLGWSAARVQGLGSINHAHFDDGRFLDSLPTEFLITDAIAGSNNNTPEILIVGKDGAKILSGRIARGDNAVLVTAELVLSRLTSQDYS